MCSLRLERASRVVYVYTRCRLQTFWLGSRYARRSSHSPAIALTSNPDNIAPPVAACLGDLVTLSLLGVIAELLVHVLNTPVPLIIVILLVIAAVGWAFVTHRNEHVKHLLKEGWSPLFVAMAISSGTGIVLDTFVERYSGFALLAVVIAGTSWSPAIALTC